MCCQQLKYTLQMTYRYRKALLSILNTTSPQLFTEQVMPEVLLKQGIKVLLLDFDGVLASHGKTSLTAQMTHWLQQCVHVFGEKKVFLLSNALTQQRVDFFKIKFPTIQMVIVNKKKPDPAGIHQVIHLTNCLPQQLILLDDRLMTGILASCIADIKVVYISQPLIQISDNVIKEIFFMSLRWLEKKWIRGLCYLFK